MRTRVIGSALIAALLLTGCSGSQKDSASPSEQAQPDGAKTTSLEKVTIEGPAQKKPKVSFEAPFAVAKAESRVYREGTGKTIAEGEQVTAHMTVVHGSDGKIQDSTYDTGKPAGFPMDPKQVSGDLVRALVGQKLGGRIAVATHGQGGQSVIYVIDPIESKKLAQRATGTPVAQKKGLPHVSIDANGKPSVSKPAGKPPTKLIVAPTMKGSGPTVKANQEVTVQYTGWTWNDTSTPFDSSWDRGQPASFPLTGVIKGWTEGIAGQKVGSQLLLITPPDKAYGKQGSPPKIGPNETLIFVVDILDAH